MVAGSHYSDCFVGAALAGILAAWAVPALRRSTGLKDDAIMGVVLGSGFGLGIALLGIAQGLPGGNQAGLESFIYGRTASMIQADAIAIGVTAAVTLLIAMVFAKEFRLLCFDESFGRAIGRREGLLDLGLMLLAVSCHRCGPASSRPHFGDRASYYSSGVGEVLDRLIYKHGRTGWRYRRGRMLDWRIDQRTCPKATRWVNHCVNACSDVHRVNGVWCQSVGQCVVWFGQPG